MTTRSRDSKITIGQSKMHQQVFILSLIYFVGTYTCLAPLKPQSLEQWLEFIGLSQYLENFTKGGFTTMNMLDYVDTDVLDDMKITSVLHRKVIINNCKSL